MGFTKLDGGIVHSSIWSEALATRVLWVTILAMADSKGLVSSSRSGLLRAANIPQSDFDLAIDILEAPDPDSRSPEYDGRRVQKCDGGWMVLNYPRYRLFTYSGSKEAIKKRKQRDKRGRKGDMSPKGGDISASASASASASDELLREFKEFWDAYDHKVAKDDALNAYKALRRSGVEKAEIARALNGYEAFLRIKKERDNFEQAKLYPASFLRKNKWRDYIGIVYKARL